MQAPDLYQRYHLGKNLLPGVFDNFYRTYNAAHIRGVDKGVLQPRYGMEKATDDALKNAIGGMFKSKEQRIQDTQPQFPSDLSGMDDSLDQAVAKLGLQVAQGEEDEDTPEMQAARHNFAQSKRGHDASLMDIERRESQPFVQANYDFQTTQLQAGKVTPQQVSPTAARSVQQNNSIPTPPPREMTPQDMGQSIELQRQKNQEESTDPNNSLDLDGDGIPDDQQAPPLDESTNRYLREIDRSPDTVTYYCQRLRRYVMEDLGDSIRELITEWKTQGSIEYIDPDTDFGSDSSVAFIYTSDNEVYYGIGKTHAGIIRSNNDLFYRYMRLLDPNGTRFNENDYNIGSKLRAEAESIDLLGRIGFKTQSLSLDTQRSEDNGKWLCSFWNDNKQILDSLLMPCLERLLADKQIKNDTLVSTPIHGTVSLGDIGLNIEREMSPEEREEIELHKRLHLMRGDEKKKAMKQLGVGVGGKAHPMQVAMTNAGLLKPGQKWWAPTSEGVLRGSDGSKH